MCRTRGALWRSGCAAHTPTLALGPTRTPSAASRGRATPSTPRTAPGGRRSFFYSVILLNLSFLPAATSLFPVAVTLRYAQPRQRAQVEPAAPGASGGARWSEVEGRSVPLAEDSACPSGGECVLDGDGGSRPHAARSGCIRAPGGSARGQGGGVQGRRRVFRLEK